MARGSRYDRRGSGPFFVVLIGVLLYFLYSVTVAFATADDCGNAPRSWTFFPPGWECQFGPNVVR